MVLPNKVLVTFLVSMTMAIGSSVPHRCFANLVAGDIAFTGFNLDGDEDFAIVALADIVNETIFFSDNEANGLGFDDTNEGVLQWSSGLASILAGTVVTFSDVATTSRAASVGTLTQAHGSFALGQSDDGILAYQSDNAIPGLNPEVFLAAIDIEDLAPSERSQGHNGGMGSSINTGLGAENILDFDDTVDGADYIGSREGELTFGDYRSLVTDIGSYQTESLSGDAILPFDSTSFTLAAVPEPSAFFFGGLACSVLGVNYVRRRWSPSFSLLRGRLS